ncbi:ABC transporter permease [Mangrovactinospora gilvigrisea]|uniref:ABC transporter permease n=1 Tax=Mangrovactinospora gilvigrisea TaxID=1428644 RepID=A0A1J7CBY4_9ACTN|nr:ABC transporter permease [Mangrovactinospora gilvigrisea]OIV37178.1 ABC transporter permease [Mangrovactinospora gilvigrisea]
MAATSLEGADAPQPRTAKAAPRAVGRLRPWQVMIALAALFVVISLARQLSGGTDLTSVGQWGGTLSFAMPIGLAGLGGLWAERAGVVNIGLEGMMVLGTFGGGYVAWHTHSAWLGLLAGIALGALGGLLHAYLTVTLGVDHIVSGVAINLLAPGFAAYLSKLAFTTPAATAQGGGQKQSPPVPGFSRITIPGLSSWLAHLDAHHWFLVSDLAGLIGGIVTGLSVITVLAVALLIGSYFVLWRTPFGLRLRSCGENPTAAESLGVNVYRYKYAAVLVSGGLAGLGGVFIAMVNSNFFLDGQTGGRGYIGLASMIFGNWRIGGLAAGAGLFGYTDSLQGRADTTSVHALLLIVAVLLIGLALWNGYRRRYLRAGIGLAIGALVVVWFTATKSLPAEFLVVTPHITTLLVMGLASQRLRMPKADGLVYRRGQGT